MKKTVIVGATPNSSRYAFRAAHSLQQHGHPIVPVGIKRGEVAGNEILDIRESPPLDDVDTITMYIGERHQAPYVDYLIGMAPRRVIFNPGAENDEFAAKLDAAGIEVVEACTLVMLSVGNY